MVSSNPGGITTVRLDSSHMTVDIVQSRRSGQLGWDQRSGASDDGVCLLTGLICQDINKVSCLESMHRHKMHVDRDMIELVSNSFEHCLLWNKV